jgi:hypothetical protein
MEEGCESAAVCLPEIGYVRQGNKLWIAFGAQKGLDESIRSSNVEIVESMDKLELEERTLSNGATVKLPKGGKWIVEGPSQRSDVKNANHRVYPRKLWEKLIGKQDSYVQKCIAERAMIGHLEHPKDGRTDLKESAILTLSAELREDGTVWNKFEILETPNGRILQELTAKGVRWGVSSRGNGTVDDSGTVSESDYVLKTWDAVAAPSTPGAYARLQGLPEDEADPKNTDESAQGALSARATASLQALTTLVESDIDGLDRNGRRTLSNSILRVLESIDRPTAASLFNKGEAWEVVMRSVERARELNAAAGETDSIDEAIETALENGETSEEHAGLMHVVESLQEQIGSSITENTDLRSRLQAAESSARELQAVHEETLEQLSKVREELQRISAQRDLANELLAEASARPDGDPRVTAKVDELISEAGRSALRDYREILCEARDPEQAEELAEKLVPRAPAKAEPPPTPAFARRSSLPAGMTVESLDGTPSRSGDRAPKSRAVQLAEAITPGAQKSRNT